MKFSFIKGAIAAGALVVSAFVGQANAGVIGLALIADASGSIGSSNWSLQMQGYHNAIEAAIPADSTIAISGTRFSSSASVFQTMTVVDGGNKAAIADAFQNEAYTGGGTNINTGILAAFNDAMASGLQFDKLIFDISTDGFGGNPDGDAGVTGSAEWAVANGVDVVNCLGIGSNANCSFIHGVGAFEVTASDFSVFESTLLAKIRRETGQDVSAPGSLALLGLGLLGVALYRRRLAA